MQSIEQKESKNRKCELPAEGSQYIGGFSKYICQNGNITAKNGIASIKTLWKNDFWDFRKRKKNLIDAKNRR